MSILAWFHALDLQLLYLINQTWSRPWLDPLMARMSDFDTWRYPLGVVVAAALIWGGFRWRQLVAIMVVCLLLGDAVIDHGFKDAVHRPRPMETEWHLRVVTVRGITESRPHPVRRGNSFTSGHACNNVALAFTAWAIFGRRAAFLWLTALLVSYSRIYCGSHYPSDIVGSWIVALCYSYFIVKMSEWLWQRYAPGKFPALYQRHPLLFPRCAGWLRLKPAETGGDGK